MSVLTRAVRRVIPSVPPLTRNRLLMGPLDLIDSALRYPDPVLRGLPPNHLRVRTGVGNRILFNARDFLARGKLWWEGQARAGFVHPHSSILDLGCGCGRCLIALRTFGLMGEPFRGRYVGLDVDGEAIGWCAANLSDASTRFAVIDRYSEVYAPNASRAAQIRFEVEDGFADFAFAISVFSHLLEDDFLRSLRELRRSMKQGGVLAFTTFCMQDVRTTPPSRWSLRHRIGPTYVESLEYPEAATGYDQPWIEKSLAETGFELFEKQPGEGQSVFNCRAV